MCEYIWIDGTLPTQKLRSKTKVFNLINASRVEDFPIWGFDGSSTSQADGSNSDCILVPVYFLRDPIRSTVGPPHYLVLCEVLNSDWTPHSSNQRAKLRDVLGISDPQKVDRTLKEEWNSMRDCWFGLEQEYTLFRGSRPLGFPDDRRFPIGQGPYYCGVGADEAFGRAMVEKHMTACLDAGILLSGINSEVMPGQWEFQIGPLGPLEVGDQLWLARWLLYRIGEDYGINATLDAKPVPGFNGAGCHLNVSTYETREAYAEGSDPIILDGKPLLFGIAAIEEACEKLRHTCQQHLEVYGAGNEARLTGAYETCSMREFRWGVGDRGASIRIPGQVAADGRGYFEDRRPAANVCPYQAVTVMMKTLYNKWE